MGGVGGEVDSAAAPRVCSAIIGALPQHFAYAEWFGAATFAAGHSLEGACR